MSVFDNIRDKLLFYFNTSDEISNEWVQINDFKSQWTIDSFVRAGYDEEVIKPHCLDCTIVNQCWFVNNEGQRPNEFDYSKYPEIPIGKRGLYHPNCHDKKIPIRTPKVEDIYIFDLARRMDYLFEKKRDWLASMGYNESDKDEVCSLLESLSKEFYCKGNYKNNPPQDEKKKKYGFRIRIYIDFPGKREKLGRVYNLYTSYIVYPNGQLKNNTPIGGR